MRRLAALLLLLGACSDYPELPIPPEEPSPFRLPEERGLAFSPAAVCAWWCSEQEADVACDEPEGCRERCEAAVVDCTDADFDLMLWCADETNCGEQEGCGREHVPCLEDL